MRRRWLWVLLVVLLLDGVVAVLLYLRVRDRHYDREIRLAARRYEMDPALVKAVVWRESRFHAGARGQAGELGLMQIREIAAEDWAVAEDIEPFAFEMLRDPQTNLLAGTWYLSHLLRRYPHTDNPLVYALADYNAGRTHVLRWAKDAAETNSAAFLEAMTYPGTRKYIREILDRYEEYR